MTNNKITAGIIGLGYVGLPLTITFGNRNKIIGYAPQHSIGKGLDSRAVVCREPDLT